MNEWATPWFVWFIFGMAAGVAIVAIFSRWFCNCGKSSADKSHGRAE